MSTAALISKSEANVETPATDTFPPIFTALPIPIPPSITRAPFVGNEESVVFENVTIPVILRMTNQSYPS